MRRYRIDNDAEPVREIQRYLLEVAHVDDRIPKVTIDGHYGDTTRNAVKAFQNTEGMEETGIVDFLTWGSLYQRHTDIRGSREEVSDFPHSDDFDLHLGDTGVAVVVLQALLTEFAAIYPNVVRPAITGQYGLATADAVRVMQRNYGLWADGIVSVTLWNRMLRDYDAKRTLSSASGSEA